MDTLRVIQENLIKDANDQYWVFGDGWLRCVGDDDPDGGYPCASFESALPLLAGMGFGDAPEVASA